MEFIYVNYKSIIEFLDQSVGQQKREVTEFAHDTQRERLKHGGKVVQFNRAEQEPVRGWYG